MRRGPRWPLDWQGTAGGRRSPVNCPRCGMKMEAHAAYYECPACGHMLELPAQQPRMSYAPSRSLAYLLRQVLHDDLAEPPTASSSPLPIEAFDAERGRLLVAGGSLWVMVAAMNIIDATSQYGVKLPALFHLICNVLLLAAILPALAPLASTARFKRVCAVLSLLLAPGALYVFGFLLEHPSLWDGRYYKLTNWLTPALFLAWTIYFIWLAIFLVREARRLGQRQ